VIDVKDEEAAATETVVTSTGAW